MSVKDGEVGGEVSHEPACGPLRLTRRARLTEEEGELEMSAARRERLMCVMIVRWVPAGAGEAENLVQKSAAREGTGAGTLCLEKKEWQLD